MGISVADANTQRIFGNEGEQQMSMGTARHASRNRLGEWLPVQEIHLATFRRDLMVRAKREIAITPLAGAVAEFGDFIGRDAVLRMNLTRSIEEAKAKGYELGFSDIDELILLINYLLSYAPPYSDTSAVMLPMNAIFEWPMCMPSGHAIFRDPAFNAHLKRILNTWCGFLSGPHSRAHLTDDAPNGWFSEKAAKRIGLDDFLSDPEQPFRGFASWNDFFTRRLRPGVRPVADPHSSKVVVNACEAAPYCIAHNVKLQDDFWVKGQPYSLLEMFGGGRRKLAQRYAGGSVYQAYLSAYNYHRWHAPVSGTIIDQYLVDGTYYSDIEAEGEDPKGLNDSQGYTSAVAARCVIVIQSDDPTVGQVTGIFVGMAEVSSCVAETFIGQHVEKGDEIGYFQFGGSTYCLLFERGVVKEFLLQPPFDDWGPPLRLNAPLARIQ